MTVAEVLVTETDPKRGCTACGSRDTVQLHPHHGRLCPDDMTLPVGPFRTDLAADIVDFGRADRAFAYLAGWLTREIEVRFAVARSRLIRRPRCHCGRSINTSGAAECAECF